MTRKEKELRVAPTVQLHFIGQLLQLLELPDEVRYVGMRVFSLEKSEMAKVMAVASADRAKIPTSV